MPLEPGKELESALVAVDPSEYIPMLDQIRSSPEEMHKFITHLAMTDPLSFKKAFVQMKGVIFNGTFVNIDTVDNYIKSGEGIKAIKYIRETTGAGLKESKQFFDQRRDKLGLTPKPF
jgi:hypothetical protein